MDRFVGTDGRGNFVLGGEPWPIHCAVYFGRRPGTCGADWLGEHFEHNFAFLPRDMELMHDLGINTLGLFVAGGRFFNGLRLNEPVYGQLLRFLDALREGGIRAILFGPRGYSREPWCRENVLDPDPSVMWHPAVNPRAEDAQIAGATAFREPLADRPEVIGYMTSVGRFFRYGFTVPALQGVWAKWLRRRFEDDFARALEALQLAPDEREWSEVRMPVEMEPYFNENNPRSFEFAVMQQTLVTEANERLMPALKAVAPRQLIFDVMEGCSFSTGHLTTLIPERTSGDAAWIECYNWEGLRSDHVQSEEERRWMQEPVADKPTVEIINNAGYVEMISRWMQRSGKPFLLCHGVDIGEPHRGARDEEDQVLMLDRFSAFMQASGAGGVAYWCWTDDEQSRTYTRQFGYEYGLDVPVEEREYLQSGETMGLLCLDGTPRPVAEKVRARSAKLQGAPAPTPPRDVLVLFPAPVFQSLYRYRANLTGFGIFTALARLGVLADGVMTSAGEDLIGPQDLADAKLVVPGAHDYERDHPGIPDLLEDYVRGGGTLFLPLARPDGLQDEYLRPRESDSLLRLSGVEDFGEPYPLTELSDISGDPQVPGRWRLPGACLTPVTPVAGAEVLASAGDRPLLYRHRLDDGTVYVFTWSLDVLIYDGERLDYPGDDWDWLFATVLRDLEIEGDPDNEMTRIVRDMTGTSADGRSG